MGVRFLLSRMWERVELMIGVYWKDVKVWSEYMFVGIFLSEHMNLVDDDIKWEF